jgi:hypothetical protein
VHGSRHAAAFPSASAMESTSLHSSPPHVLLLMLLLCSITCAFSSSPKGPHATSALGAPGHGRRLRLHPSLHPRLSGRVCLNQTPERHPKIQFRQVKEFPFTALKRSASYFVQMKSAAQLVRSLRVALQVLSSITWNLGLIPSFLLFCSDPAPIGP